MPFERLSSACPVLASLSLALLTACGARSLATDTPQDPVASPLSTGSAPPPVTTGTAPPSSSDHDTGPVSAWLFRRGTRPTGDGCAFGSQCASGVCSANASAGECGRCLEVRGLGESCDGALQGCYPSARCQGGVCTSLRKTVGATCALGPKGGDEGECDLELHCDGEPGAEQGTCAPRLALGAGCENSYEATPCAPGALCLDGVCAANLPGASGESCLGRVCQAGLECLHGENYVCGPGTLPPGAACGVVDGNLVEAECAPGTTCGNLDWPNGGGGQDTLYTCVARPLEGQPCMLGHCADGLFCRVLETKTASDPPYRCERPRGLGEACSTAPYGAIECAAGLECRKGACALPCP